MVFSLWLVVHLASGASAARTAIYVRLKRRNPELFAREATDGSNRRDLIVVLARELSKAVAGAETVAAVPRRLFYDLADCVQWIHIDHQRCICQGPFLLRVAWKLLRRGKEPIACVRGQLYKELMLGGAYERLDRLADGQPITDRNWSRLKTDLMRLHEV